jgi:hypothetical protein
MSEFIHDEKSSNSGDKVDDIEKNDSTWAPLLAPPTLTEIQYVALVVALPLPDFDVSTFRLLPQLQLTDLACRIPTSVNFLLLATDHWELTLISDKDAAIAGVLEDDSPYPEVRSAVANTDDETIPVGTMRSWVLGIVWSIIIPVCFLKYHLQQ